MILPTGYPTALLLLGLALLLLGSWANTQKLAGKWRFELFYYDYSLGVLLCAVAAAFTLGSMNTRELTFQDNFLITGYRNMAFGVAAGMVFNLANLLLLAAVSASGMAIAFPLVVGLALVFGVGWNFLANPQENLMLLFGGSLLVLAAVVINAIAFSDYRQALAEAAKTAFLVDPRAKNAPKTIGAARALVLSVIGGLIMSLAFPLSQMSRSGENGVGPYGFALMAAAGIFASTLFYVPFFANFPVSGRPVEVARYFTGTKRDHLLGILGGVLWAGGTISALVAATAPLAVNVNAAVGTALAPAAALVSALWGLLAWHEFKDAGFRTKMLLVTMFVLFIAGVSMVALGPVYASK